jgi:hypothetical protein
MIILRTSTIAPLAPTDSSVRSNRICPNCWSPNATSTRHPRHHRHQSPPRHTLRLSLDLQLPSIYP